MTDAELATAVAVTLGRRWGYDPGEYLGAAWEGVCRARRAGQSDRVAFRAGVRGVIDALRSFNGRGDTFGGGRARMRETCERLSHFNAPAASPEVPDPYARRLEFWGETRRPRKRLCWCARVATYLYAVEGMTMKDVGQCLGVTETRVSQMVGQIREEFCGGEVPGGADAPDDRGAGAGVAEAPGRSGIARGELRTTGGAPAGIDAPAPAGATGTPRDARGVDGGGGPVGEEQAGSQPVEGVAAQLRRVGGGGRVGGGSAAVPAGDVPENSEPVPADGPPPRGSRRGVATVVKVIPNPVAMSRKAAALRESVLDAVGKDDLAAVVAAQLEKAKKGDAAAAKLILALIGAA